MNALRLLLGVLGIAMSMPLEAEEKVTREVPAFSQSVLSSWWGYQRAIVETYPALQAGCFLVNGRNMVGVYYDREAPRILIVARPDDVRITRNSEPVKMPPGEEATIRLLWSESGVDGESKDMPNRFTETAIGRWMPLKRTDSFEMKGRFDYPAKSEFHVTYDPDRGWAGTLSRPEFDEKEIAPGDAYEISLESLAGRVMEVLEKKEDCLVKFRRRGEVNLQRWKVIPQDDSAAKNWRPIMLTVNDGIEITAGPAMERLTVPELDQRLEMYRAALSGDGVSVVRLRVAVNASDELFREVLGSLWKMRLTSKVFVEVMERKREVPAEADKTP